MVEEVSRSEDETMKIAETLVNSLSPNKRFLCLFGDLGSGKTVFVKGVAKAFQIENYSVKSPTYTFVREYIHKTGKLIHVDLYRLEQPDDILLEQIEEYASKENTLVVIEWAERMKDAINAIPAENKTDICFEYIDPTTRKITIF